MLLTITTTRAPATDLGWLLHKHPARHQQFELAFGTAEVLFPEATDERCTFALVLDVDPVRIVRGKGRITDAYVNDRAYVASSLMSVALARVLRTAMAGRCNDRPELPEEALPLEARVAVVAGDPEGTLVRALFEPLGWSVETEPHDVTLPGEVPRARYHTVRLTGTARLADLLTHLYVLLPVLDDDKHHYVGRDEVDKLLARGAGWLETHPAKPLIVRRYLRHRRSLVREALARLITEDEAEHDGDVQEALIERPLRLFERRLEAVVEILVARGARDVVDLGCGDGKLLKRLAKVRSFERLTGVDASVLALEQAARRLRLEETPEHQKGRLRLLHGALTYRDSRLDGADAAALVEVVEHVDPGRLPALARCVFGELAAATVVVTTPNREYNVRFEGMAAGAVRHRDHRFEWTRPELEAWATEVATRYGYEVRFAPIGEVDPEVGAPTQMAVFTR